MSKLIWLAVVGMLMAGAAWGHQAPMGWWYDGDCCSDKDCRQAPTDAVEEVPGGWIIKPSGVFVKHGSITYPKEKKSKDEFFHVCTGIDQEGHQAGDIASKNVYCLYHPDFGS